MNSSLIFFQDTGTRVELFRSEKGGANKIVIIFNPVTNKNLEGNKFGGSLLNDNGFDVIQFKSINDDWYQSIPENIFNELNIFIQEAGYGLICSYGSSMGGHAAILFSKKLNCNICLALSPQYSIYEAYDTRWSIYAKNIKFKYLMGEDNISKCCKYFIYFDPKDDDSKHIDRFKNIIKKSQLYLEKIPYSGHPVTDFLVQTGTLKKIPLHIFNEGELLNLDIRTLRHSSKSYFFWLSQKLVSKNKNTLALKVVDLALIKNFNMASFLRQKAIILDRLNRLENAIQAAHEAILLEDNHPNFLTAFGRILNKNKSYKASLEYLNAALTIDKNNPWTHYHKSVALKGLGQFDAAQVSIKLAIAIDGENAIFKDHQERSN